MNHVNFKIATTNQDQTNHISCRVEWHAYMVPYVRSNYFIAKIFLWQDPVCLSKEENTGVLKGCILKSSTSYLSYDVILVNQTKEKMSWSQKTKWYSLSFIHHLSGYLTSRLSNLGIWITVPLFINSRVPKTLKKNLKQRLKLSVVAWDWSSGEVMFKKCAPPIIWKNSLNTWSNTWCFRGMTFHAS